MSTATRNATMAGAVVSAFLASACCIGPLVLALLGLGGAGLLFKLEPYRPYFTGATALALGAGFWLTYRKPRLADGDACACEMPTSSRIARILLWAVTAIAVAFWSFPYIADKVFG
jgi:mercuric ion transport protein